jgi:hypothetical protein
MTYVFAIPRYITLPNDMANKECPNDEEELLETLKNLAQSIIEVSGNQRRNFGPDLG